MKTATIVNIIFGLVNIILLIALLKESKGKKKDDVNSKSK